MKVLYQHIRLDTNEVFYVGIGKLDRAYCKGRNTWWQKIVDKAGYKVEILLDKLTWEEACKYEKILISLYGRRNLGVGTLVNLTDGGEGVFPFSQITKDKLSKINTGVGNPRGMKGKKHSEESIEKMKKSHQKRKLNNVKIKKDPKPIIKKDPKPIIKKILSEEHKLKISIANKNKKVSDETKTKQSQAKKGDKHFMYGKSLSENHKRNLSESQKGKKISIETLQKIRNTNTKKKEFKEFFDMLRQKDPRQIFIDNFKRKRDL